MKQIAFFFVIAASLFTTAKAQRKLALLIGINTYQPAASQKPSQDFLNRSITDLDGAINDVALVNNVLQAKFGFQEDGITFLRNEQATRANITNELKQLANKANKGDIVFFYFAGHGSQVKNSLSSEPDQKDETLVPADAWQTGVTDIRDKELAILFNMLLDKGVILTVIFDCCHSGSLQRGPEANACKNRSAKQDTRDSKDPSNPPAPEANQNGTFLIVTACQDNEQAEERIKNGEAHGAFTYAWASANAQLSPNISVELLFQSLRGILKADNLRQEPVLSFTSSRRDQSMLGLSAGSFPENTTIAVSGIKDGHVYLQGGYAIGLLKNTRLAFVTGADSIILQVDSVLGPTTCYARIIKGKRQLITGGQLFHVIDWATGDLPLLSIYIPESVYSGTDIDNQALRYASLSNNKKFTAVGFQDAEQLLYFDNKKYYIFSKQSATTSTVDINELSSLVKGKFYFDLAPSAALVKKLKEQLQRSAFLKLVSNAAEADYIIYGTVSKEGEVAYGLRAKGAAMSDTLGSLPLFTAPVPTRNNDNALLTTATTIYSNALQLAKLKAWLQVSSPPTAAQYFPFHLEVRNSESGISKAMAPAVLREKLSLFLVLNKDHQAEEMAISNMFFYLFSVDANGKMRLHYPSGAENCNSYYNRITEESIEILKDNPLINYTAGKPVGTDNFFVLATNRPIDNCTTYFNQAGTGATGAAGSKSGINDQLLGLLDMGNEGSNRKEVFSSEKWALLRVAVTTIP